VVFVVDRVLARQDSAGCARIWEKSGFIARRARDGEEFFNPFKMRTGFGMTGIRGLPW
jgi:hypothetical protein